MDQKNPEMEVISASSLELIQRAEIDMQVATAKKYPRKEISVIKKRMMDFATLDEETAEACFYSLPRDGKTIQGPSVRLAEIAVSCYGNLRGASRVIGNDGRFLTSQGACHDLENNNLISVEVMRRITDKKGKTYSEDMQMTAGNAANSIAFRNAVFKVVPSALWRPVYEQARLVAVGTATTLVSKRQKMIKRLNSMEVDTPRILVRLGRAAVEDITLADLEVLIGAGTAIRDGDTSVDEAFPAVDKQGTADREARLERQMAEQGEDKPAPEQKQEPQQETKASPKEEVKVTSQPANGNWPDRQAMLADFRKVIDEIGEEEAIRMMGNDGIAGDDDLSIQDASTLTVYKKLQALAQALVQSKKAEKAPENGKTEKFSFGRRNR